MLFVVAPALATAPPLAKIVDRVYFTSYGWSEGEQFRNPGGVYFYPKRNEVYVADTGNHQIVIFDTVGTPITRIRHDVDGMDPGSIRPGEPRRLAINSHGDIYVVDNLARYVDVLDYRGRSITRIYPADLLGTQRVTTGCSAVAVDSQDNVYIGTSGDEITVLVLDRNHKLLRRIGTKGEGKGSFQGISSLWVDDAGRVYVTDPRGEPCVQVFSPDGSELLSFGAHSAGPNNFSLPEGVVTDEIGDIYVLDNLRHLVAVFGPDGRFITRLGGFGNAPGDLAYPSGLGGDGKKVIFTVEKSGGRLQGFKLDITPPEKAG